MELHIGPVASSSALAWLEDARKSLKAALEHPALPFEVPCEVVEGFERFMDSWMWEADSGPVFDWSEEVDPSSARHLVHHWFNVATFMTEQREARGEAPLPPEAEAFSETLVTAVMGALATEEESHDFAERVLQAWPIHWSNSA